MKGFIVDRTYRILDGKAYVYLFGRLANGESFLTITHVRPYFYIRAKDLDAAKAVHNFKDIDETEMRTMQGEPVVKLTLWVPRDVAEWRKRLEDAGIPCYEADIPFTQRYLMDLGINATIDIQGEHKKGRYVQRIYEEPTLTPVEYQPNVTTVSIDIETSKEHGDLFMISLVTRDKELTLVNKEEVVALPEHAERFATEKDLLERFVDVIREWDPDIITGWNVIDFDLQDLKRRCEQNGVRFILGRAEWESGLRIESSFLRDSQADIAGRAVLDGIHILKSSFINLEDYKLETAAQEFLGEGKLLTGKSRYEEIERLYHEDTSALVAYNRKDCRLVLDILEAKQLIQLTVLRSMLTGLIMERVRASIASFDSVYIRAMNRRGLVAPSTRPTERGERITGGYVRESKPGVYDEILVLDFKSMYPSVIRTFNIDPISYLPEGKQERTDEKIIVAPNGACFTNSDGLLPTIIQQLWEERDNAKRRKDGVASLAIKVLMNSFFGVLASPNCRFFSLEMGNAITGFARHFIRIAAEKIEERGYTVVYGDTDSVFVETRADDPEGAFAIGTELQEYINTFYREHIEQVYHRTSFMELQAEKVYRKFLLPRVRGSEVGAKKRYAGLKWVDGEERLDFTGLEFVRRDWTELAKHFQMELLDRIFHDREVTGFVKRFVDDVRAGKHDDELIYRKSIRKDLSEYTKTTPPHVKAARILEQREGRIEQSVISYVMTSSGPEPVGYESGPIDYDHYIEKQIRPIADSVLDFYGSSFDDLIAGSSQTTLGGF